MIFITFNPYDENIMDKKNDIEDCFICFELIDFNNKIPIRLDDQNNYFKICNCNGWIHTECLNHWCKLNKKCPICRNVMDKHLNYMITLFNEKIYKDSYLSNIVILLLRNYTFCYRLGSIILIMYLFLNLLFTIFFYDYDRNNVHNFYSFFEL